MGRNPRANHLHQPAVNSRRADVRPPGVGNRPRPLVAALQIRQRPEHLPGFLGHPARQAVEDAIDALNLHWAPLEPTTDPIAAHQVRMSNGPAIVAMLGSHGFHDALHEHVVDKREALEDRIAFHLEAADVIVLSGGVSMGKADFVPEVLDRLGVRIVFHKVLQRPGKPMWFGMAPGNKAVFALPGNPVSALVCCRQYVVPALDRASGRRA